MLGISLLEINHCIKSTKSTITPRYIHLKIDLIPDITPKPGEASLTVVYMVRSFPPNSFVFLKIQAVITDLNQYLPLTLDVAKLFGNFISVWHLGE